MGRHRLLAALATRGVGVEAALGSLPLPVLVLFAAVTQLGDTWFYFVVLAGAYWAGDRVPGLDRRRAAFLLGAGLLALALTVTLKGIFALPRPPGAGTAERADALPALVRPLYEGAATDDGFGFPSGHATGAALVWGGTAVVLDAGRRRTRLAAGVAVVALVGLSRVVLGVHYLVDVLAGFALGGVALAALLRLGAVEKPGRPLGLAVLVGLVGAAATFGTDQLTALGAALGARVAWGAVGGDAVRVPATRGRVLLTAAVGYPVFGGLFGAVEALDPGPTVAFLGGAVVLAGVVALPAGVDAVLERVGTRRPVE
jgi:membrane-associated phospholipid phosphatase